VTHPSNSTTAPPHASAHALNHVEINFTPACDVEAAARIIDTLAQLNAGDDRLWGLHIEGLPPAMEAMVMEALRAEAEAIEAERAAAPRIKGKRKSPKPTLNSIAKDARKAGIDPARIEISPDGSYAVDTVKREPAEPQTSWPLDEFRSKETKQ